MAHEPNSDNGLAVDLGPFAHEREAEQCRRVMGDRAHGLDTVVETLP